MANPIEEMMNTAMTNIKSMVDVNTVIGNPVTTPDGTMIIPVSTVSFGFGAGGSEFSGDKKALKSAEDKENALFGGGCGGGANVKPIAFLVVGNGTMKMMPVVPDNSPVNKVLDAVPDVVNKMNGFIMDLADKRERKKAGREEASAANETKTKQDTKNGYVDVAP